MLRLLEKVGVGQAVARNEVVKATTHSPVGTPGWAFFLSGSKNRTRNNAMCDVHNTNLVRSVPLVVEPGRDECAVLEIPHCGVECLGVPSHPPIAKHPHSTLPGRCREASEASGFGPFRNRMYIGLLVTQKSYVL